MMRHCEVCDHSDTAISEQSNTAPGGVLAGGAVKAVMARFGAPAYHLTTCALMFLSVAIIEYFTHKMTDTPLQLSKTLLQVRSM